MVKVEERKKSGLVKQPFAKVLERPFCAPDLNGNGNDGRSVKGSNVNLIGWVTHVTSLLLGHTRNKSTVGLM